MERSRGGRPGSVSGQRPLYSDQTCCLATDDWRLATVFTVAGQRRTCTGFAVWALTIRGTGHPYCSGYSVVSVILRTLPRESSDRIAAFDAGADGYLAKPFSARELRAMARRFLPLAKTGAFTPIT